MSNTRFLILRGKENSGKTTLCAEVYRQLLPFAKEKHLFGKCCEQMKIVVQDSIKVDEQGNTCDFQALLDVVDKKVAFFSMGDKVSECFKTGIQSFIDKNVEILVCCTRSQNRKNSTFKYIEETYTGFCKKVYWTKYAPNKRDMSGVKQEQAEEIKQYILAELKA